MNQVSLKVYGKSVFLLINIIDSIRFPRFIKCDHFEKETNLNIHISDEAIRLPNLRGIHAFAESTSALNNIKLVDRILI